MNCEADSSWEPLPTRDSADTAIKLPFPRTQNDAADEFYPSPACWPPGSKGHPEPLFCKTFLNVWTGKQSPLIDGNKVSSSKKHFHFDQKLSSSFAELLRGKQTNKPQTSTERWVQQDQTALISRPGRWLERNHPPPGSFHQDKPCTLTSDRDLFQTVQTVL